MGQGDVHKPDRSPPARVLFVCTHNAVRSPMAHALSQGFYPKALRSQSAGMHSLTPVDPMAVAAMRELGLDITEHQPHTVADLEASGDDLGAYDLIVALSPAAAEAAREAARYTDAPVELWPVEDPTAEDGPNEQRLAAYRAARDAILARLRERFGAPGAS